MIGIDKLKQYFIDYSIKLEKIELKNTGIDFAIKLTINNQSWQIGVDDEYNNYDSKNELLTLFLVFYSLETYKESSDFLVWCKELNLDASDSSLLTYYQSLRGIVISIENVIGEIDSCISSYDYALQSGEFLELISPKL